MLTPFLVFIFCIIFIASIGKSIGIRRLYVNVLLKIFEFGRINIETAIKRSQKESEESENIIRNNDTKKLQQQNQQYDLQQQQRQQYQQPKQQKVEEEEEDGQGTQRKMNGNGFLPSNQTNGNTVIDRDALILVPDAEFNYKIKDKDISNNKNDEELVNGFSGGDGDNVNDTVQVEKSLDFQLANCLDYVKAGMEAIIEDEVTSRFEAEELKNWNLLTRTNRRYEFISWRLTVIWVCGFFVRYFVLMPLRVFICFIGVSYAVISFALVGCIPYAPLRRLVNDLTFKITFRIIARSISAVIDFHNPEFKPKNCGFCVANHTSPIDIAILATDCSFSLVVWLTICTALVGCIPEGDSKRWMVRKVSIHCFSVLASAISAVVNYHNIDNRPGPGICVANHTSPIDALVLMCDNCYSLIGQRHGGFLGILQRALARASPHIWFERAEAKDRMAVAKRLRQHVSDPNNPPILIFPEGTCINNTSVMQFKKGSFEVGGVIYPVAIKYDAKFGDAFWNSSRYSMMQYLYLMMTSWAIVCDVWYLPPMYRMEDETAIDFANRVKSVIAKQGGLVDLMWDGQLKRIKPKKEWKEKQQEEFSKRLKGE